MSKLLTRTGHVALLHITKAIIIPASAEGYTQEDGFLLRTVGATAMSVQCQLVDNADDEIITVIVTQDKYSAEMVKTVVDPVVASTLIAGF